MTNEDLQQIQNLVASAQRVLILTHNNPSVDTMASALAIYLAMSKMGKDATIAMESQPLVEVSNLVGIDRVKTSLEGKNLLLTYKPYSLGDFEKVSYIEDQGQAGTLDDSFKLTITPREGFTPDPRSFQFSATGASADLIYTVDVLEPAQLGRLYDPGLLSSVPVINIDNHDPNKDYGRFNLVEPEAASISEIVTFFLRAVNAQLDADTAGNLYQGIVSASGNFQSGKVAAATFEAAAICLRSGAKSAAIGPLNQQAATGPVPTGTVPMSQPPRMAQPVRSQPQRPFNQTQSNRPQPFDSSQGKQQQNRFPNQGQPFDQTQGKPFDSFGTAQDKPTQGKQPQAPRPNDVPEDWNQPPKAYRGTSTV